MSIDAYVFDAYGTLYDVQSVSQITDIEYPDHGELITQHPGLAPQTAGIHLAPHPDEKLSQLLGHF